jgi:hypothetical protein
MELSRKFTDALKREWVVYLPWTTAQRITAETGVTLDDLIPKEDAKDTDMRPLYSLITDGMRLFPVLWAIFRPECEKKGISQEQFGEGFDGETFVSAAQAFMGGLHSFFPHPLRKAMVLHALEKGNQAMAISVKRLAKDMAAVNVEAELEKLWKSGLTTLQESSESTPAPKP